MSNRFERTYRGYVKNPPNVLSLGILADVLPASEDFVDVLEVGQWYLSLYGHLIHVKGDMPNRYTYYVYYPGMARQKNFVDKPLSLKYFYIGSEERKKLLDIWGKTCEIVKEMFSKPSYEPLPRDDVVIVRKKLETNTLGMEEESMSENFSITDAEEFPTKKRGRTSKVRNALMSALEEGPVHIPTFADTLGVTPPAVYIQLKAIGSEHDLVKVQRGVYRLG